MRLLTVVLFGFACMSGALGATTYSNSQPINVPDIGEASPYPSVITVADATSPLSNVAITLNGLTHTWPGDLQIVLVAPNGLGVPLMGNAGGAILASNVTLTFDDTASASLPIAGQLSSGTYEPTTYPLADGSNYFNPAGGALAYRLEAFQGSNPNGRWSLYVDDHSVLDAGAVTGGWSLVLNGCQPGTGGELRVQTQPASTTIGYPLPVQPVISVLDTCGNPQTSYNGPVSVFLAKGGGTVSAHLTGTTTVQAVNGIATFQNLAVDAPGSAYYVAASAPGYAPVKAGPFGVYPARVYVKPAAQGGSDANNGTSWATALATPGAATASIAAHGEIWVAMGTYMGGISLPGGVALYGGFAGTETDLGQRNVASHATILDGGSTVGPVKIVSTTPVPTIADGFTLQNGAGSIFVAGSGPGGTHVSVLGGGIYAQGSNITISNNTIQNCKVDGNTGGGLISGGAIYLTGTGAISHNTILNNTAPGTSGAIVATAGDVTIDGNNVHDNTAGIAGGSIISNNTVSRNTAYGISCSGTTVIRDNVITGNGSTSALGGIEVSLQSASESAIISDNLVAENIGSGIYMDASAGDTVKIQNNTIVDNGRDSSISAGTMLYYVSNATIANNIVAFNGQAGGPGGMYFYQSTATMKNNDVFGNLAANFSGTADPTGVNGNISLDPLFADHAGGDYHLTASSPGVDTGSDTYVAAGDTDLDGKPRIIGAQVDIGAYEYGTAPFSASDVARALVIAGGLQTASATDSQRLAGPSAARIDLAGAVRITRKAAGLDTNP